MEVCGRLIGTTIDVLTGKMNVTFEIDTKPMDALRELSGIQLDIKALKHREKRSLDSNAYFHVLVGKIANELKISKTKCKNILIGRYGQQETLDDGTPVVIKTNIGVDQMMEQEFLHCVPCGSKVENGAEVVFYKVFRGSHTLNTWEMSILIEGTVQEAKELGIETMAPDELERMLNAWKGGKE